MDEQMNDLVTYTFHKNPKILKEFWNMGREKKLERVNNY